MEQAEDEYQQKFKKIRNHKETKQIPEKKNDEIGRNNDAPKPPKNDERSVAFFFISPTDFGVVAPKPLKK